MPLRRRQSSSKRNGSLVRSLTDFFRRSSPDPDVYAASSPALLDSARDLLQAAQDQDGTIIRQDRGNAPLGRPAQDASAQNRSDFSACRYEGHPPGAMPPAALSTTGSGIATSADHFAMHRSGALDPNQQHMNAYSLGSNGFGGINSGLADPSSELLMESGMGMHPPYATAHVQPVSAVVTYPPNPSNHYYYAWMQQQQQHQHQQESLQVILTTQSPTPTPNTGNHGHLAHSAATVIHPVPQPQTQQPQRRQVNTKTHKFRVQIQCGDRRLDSFMAMVDLDLLCSQVSRRAAEHIGCRLHPIPKKRKHESNGGTSRYAPIDVVSTEYGDVSARLNITVVDVMEDFIQLRLSPNGLKKLRLFDLLACLQEEAAATAAASEDGSETPAASRLAIAQGDASTHQSPSCRRTRTRLDESSPAARPTPQYQLCGSGLSVPVPIPPQQPAAPLMSNQPNQRAGHAVFSPQSGPTADAAPPGHIAWSTHDHLMSPARASLNPLSPSLGPDNTPSAILGLRPSGPGYGSHISFRLHDPGPGSGSGSGHFAPQDPGETG